MRWQLIRVHLLGGSIKENVCSFNSSIDLAFDNRILPFDIDQYLHN